MRFVFTPPAEQAAGLLTLPWTEPLGEWREERLVEIRQRGISRHVADWQLGRARPVPCLPRRDHALGAMP